MSDVSYKSVQDFIIEIGSNYTIFAGVLFGISIFLIYSDWRNSVLEHVITTQSLNGENKEEIM